MLLAIDVSNTLTTLATFEGDKLHRIFRITTKETRSSDEYGVLLRNLVDLSDASYHDIEGIIISSVVPGRMHAINSACIRYFGLKPIIIGLGVRTGIKVKAADQKEVGSDLIVNAAAVHELYPGPAIVIDFGTATIYQVVQEDGTRDSVVIVPGVQVSLNALVSQAARIPDVEIKKPRTILNNSTTECIQAGIFYGTVGQTEYIVRRLKKESGLADARVISTGEFAKMISMETDCVDHYDPWLTLQGLRIIFDKNRRRK